MWEAGAGRWLEAEGEAAGGVESRSAAAGRGGCERKRLHRDFEVPENDSQEFIFPRNSVAVARKNQSTYDGSWSREIVPNGPTKEFFLQFAVFLNF